ncbi:MAG: hypothetical protein WCK35_25135 [Chloroflexota bacterium]
MYFEAEFYSYDHVVHGHVDTPQDRLSDLLNSKNDTSLIIRDAYISRLSNTGKAPPIHMAEVRMEKHSVLFAYPAERDLSPKSMYRRATRQVFPVGVLLPNFELVGLLHLTERLEIHRVLLSRPDDFIPLTHATVTYSLFPDLKIWRSTIIFNKNHMILIGEQSLGNLPAAPGPQVAD